MGEWNKYDRDQPRVERVVPADDDLVWIFDEFYDGVTVGRWIGWWVNGNGSDDLGVTHWMPMEKPDPPAGSEETRGA